MIMKLDYNNIIYNKVIAQYSPYNNYYYNTITNEYFGQNYCCRFYFNLKGQNHRIDGPAHLGTWNLILYYINNIHYNELEFADLTNHLICKNCNNFCKQKCF